MLPPGRAKLLTRPVPSGSPAPRRPSGCLASSGLQPRRLDHLGLKSDRASMRLVRRRTREGDPVAPTDIDARRPDCGLRQNRARAGSAKVPASAGREPGHRERDSQFGTSSPLAVLPQGTTTRLRRSRSERLPYVGSFELLSAIDRGAKMATRIATADINRYAAFGSGREGERTCPGSRRQRKRRR